MSDLQANYHIYWLRAYFWTQIFAEMKIQFNYLPYTCLVLLDLLWAVQL